MFLNYFLTADISLKDENNLYGREVERDKAIQNMK